MPITQSRLNELIQTAEDYAQAAEHLIAQIHQFVGNVRAAGQATDAALSMLLLSADLQALLKRPLQSFAIVRLERDKYKSTFKRNLRRAESLRVDRLRSGKHTASSRLAPTSLIKPELSLEDHPAVLSAQEAELTRLEAAAMARVAQGKGHHFPKVAPDNPPSPPAALLQEVPTRDDRELAARDMEEGSLREGLDFGGGQEEEEPIAPGDYSSGKVKGQTV